MHTDEFCRFYAPRENRCDQVNLMVANPIKIQQDGIQLDVAAIPDNTLFLIPISFMMIWAIVVFVSSDIWIFARHEMLTVKHLHQVPCKNCRFFKNNPYLQCAVHPSNALTPKAINCSDYLRQNGRC